MKITILGSGASGGVPYIGCSCAVCSSDNPKNKRKRVSVYVEHNDTKLLIDTSPDLRQQALDNNIKIIDAVLYTHAHADHTHGIAEIRSFNYIQNTAIPAYGNKEAMEEIKQRFCYAFQPPVEEYGWFRPCLLPYIIKDRDVINIKGASIESFPQQHGQVTTLGYRIGGFAYSTDTNFLPEAAFETLEGVEVWVVDCLKYKPAPTHAHLDMVLSWIEQVSPKQAILTHMGHDMEYDELSAQLPSNVQVAYDGMVLTV